jgi:hypothetical protein
MKFYVVMSDGRKFGPADIATLNQWIVEGRVNRDTMLENADNEQQARARDVMGLKFVAQAPDLGGTDPALRAQDPLRPAGQPVQIPGQPTPYVAGAPEDTSSTPSAPSNPYGNPPQPGTPYPRSYDPHIDDGSQKLVTTAWILIAVGFALCCIFVTPFGIYNANRAKNMGNATASTPLLIGWIVFGLQIVGLLIYGLVVVLAITSGSAFPGS